MPGKDTIPLTEEEIRLFAAAMQRSSFNDPLQPTPVRGEVLDDTHVRISRPSKEEEKEEEIPLEMDEEHSNMAVDACVVCDADIDSSVHHALCVGCIDSVQGMGTGCRICGEEVENSEICGKCFDNIGEEWMANTDMCVVCSRPFTEEPIRYWRECNHHWCSRCWTLVGGNKTANYPQCILCNIQHKYGLEFD